MEETKQKFKCLNFARKTKQEFSWVIYVSRTWRIVSRCSTDIQSNPPTTSVVSLSLASALQKNKSNWRQVKWFEKTGQNYSTYFCPAVCCLITLDEQSKLERPFIRSNKIFWKKKRRAWFLLAGGSYRFRMTAIEEKGWPSSCIVWRKKSAALVSFHQEEEDDARLILNGALLSTSASIQFGHHSILLLLSYYGGSCWQRIYSLSDSIVGNVHTNPSFLSQIKKAIMTMPGPFWLCVFTTQNNRQEKEKSSFLF
jgi:hypothetical protein